MKDNLGKLILRLGVGGLMLPHGFAKLEKLIHEGLSTGFADPFHVGSVTTLIIAILAELISPVLVIIGYKTRWACILPALTMLTAALVIHADDPWSKVEFPLLYFTGFIGIALLGPGKWSLDGRG